ncbi:F-box/kelch-repeat protein At3g23880-like [Abrus precatorius]|uniref:F-box/kelch-repeat protein At3g23880-like n=1 Tax=Abrus precatorius TaxID=3816 RepID=A0A8B8M6Z5_ABRPR|nr:F-box/kelch-repeat protein At3g23880-like [Abrus precatorius]
MGSELSNSILFEFFCKLPTQKAAQCRLLSKYWNEESSSKIFKEKHTAYIKSKESPLFVEISIHNRNVDPSRLLVLISISDKEIPKRYVTLPVRVARFGWFNIINTLNGIICFRFGTNGESSKLVMWNPTMKVHKFVPNSKPEIGTRVLLDGLCYDEGNEDYKIVSVFKKLEDGAKPWFKVFSSTNDSWSAPADLPFNVHEHIIQSWYSRGFLFFLDVDNTANKTIVQFNVNNSSFNHFELPSSTNNQVCFQGWSLFGTNVSNIERYHECLCASNCIITTMKEFHLEDEESYVIKSQCIKSNLQKTRAVLRSQYATALRKIYEHKETLTWIN